MNEVFKALSDPTRREILRILSRGERTAGELAEPFDMTKPSVSHHFAVLKEAGLVRSRREGQQIVYSLDTTVVEDVLTRLWDLFGSGNANGTGGTPGKGAMAHDAGLLDRGGRAGGPDLGSHAGDPSGAAGEDPDALEHPRAD
jgi:DNA-binding transcriptional ArsR family regulator